jgi:hypothetical protein
MATINARALGTASRGKLTFAEPQASLTVREAEAALDISSNPQIIPGIRRAS